MMDFSLACRLVMSGGLFGFLKDLRCARIIRQAQDMFELLKGRSFHYEHFEHRP